MHELTVKVKSLARKLAELGFTNRGQGKVKVVSFNCLLGSNYVPHVLAQTYQTILKMLRSHKNGILCTTLQLLSLAYILGSRKVGGRYLRQIMRPTKLR